MAVQSGIVVSSACLLLLVLLPLTLAQDDCKYGYLPYYSTTPNWPDCLLDRLPNRLNGTYYIRPEGPENTSCPAQPCRTLTQLQDEFFVLNDGYYETSPNGDTSLVFLPGTHDLQLDTDIDFIGDYHSTFSLIGYNYSHPLSIITCIGFGPFFSGFTEVTITHLRFNNCTVYIWQDVRLIVDFVIFDYSLLDVRYVESAIITNSSIVITSGPYCNYRVELYGIFYINSSHARLRNMFFSSDHLPCDDAKLLTINDGVLDIADSAFLGKGNQIVLRNSTLNASGTVRFQNGDPAIQALNSTVNLAGNVSFINNTAYQGGAMSLTDSHVTIADNAHVRFQDNHAEYVGGAIFSSGNDISNYVSIGQTFGQPTIDSCRISFGVNTSVKFINNTAESGGSAMYGITLSKLVCSGGLDQYNTLFDSLSIDPDDFSAVSSDPLRVCICPDQSTPDCLAILPDQNIPHFHYTVYPGQHFTIPAAVVGFNFALTSGSVYAQFLNSDTSLGSESQYVQGVSHTGCAPLQYSILSDKKYDTLVLTTNGRSIAAIRNGIMDDVQVLQNNEGYKYLDGSLYNYFSNPDKYYSNNRFETNLTDGVFRIAGHVPRPLQDIPIFISLTLLDCPPGFTLSDHPHKCECERVLIQKYNLTCNINDQTVHREGTTWINASFTGNSSNGVIVHQHCPFGYCKQEPVDVNLTNPDTQCAFNRSGILCGACKPNFSLALGSSQCLPNCSNKYVSLLIPFALAGFALVFFISILNLTVSQGTINGLIFYANIVATNRTIFFPAQYSKFLSFLHVFISWLNLELGIETCFNEGLGGYGKTWLQLDFPFYVWAIAGAIILVSHYSTRATRIFGENSLSVLATMFLLSYSKILRSASIIFGSTTLIYPDDSISVWTFDGNIRYLSLRHIPLFLIALAIVVLALPPYTGVLLSAKWLRTQTHRDGLRRWLKPFLDAYYGPFKDKHHYWVGVLLVVRGVLSIAIENNVNLLLIIVSCFLLFTCVSVTGRLYKKIYLTVLENSFFLNLGVLAAGTLYIRLVGGSQEALATASIGIAFLQFVGIIAFHSYNFIIIPLGKKCKDYVKSKDRQQANRNELNTPFIFKNVGVTHSEVYLSVLHRETATELSPEHQPPPAEINIDENIAATFNHDTPQDPLKKLTICASNEAAGAPKKSEAAAVPLDELPPPQESNKPSRYFAAEREGSIDFTAPRESLLEFTQYHLQQESNEPPRYFAAERESRFIDFNAPRESLLEFTR